jgi:hypothetical protein
VYLRLRRLVQHVCRTGYIHVYTTSSFCLEMEIISDFIAQSAINIHSLIFDCKLVYKFVHKRLHNLDIFMLKYNILEIVLSAFLLLLVFFVCFCFCGSGVAIYFEVISCLIYRYFGGGMGLGLWFLTPLSTEFQRYRYKHSFPYIWL